MKIKASELRPGDIIDGNKIALYIRAGGDGITWACHDINNYQKIQWPAVGEIEVWREPLTLPMQHADEAFRLLRRVQGAFGSKQPPLVKRDLEQITALLDKVDPPKPPTVEEMAVVLERLVSLSETTRNRQGANDAARKILARIPLPTGKKDMHPEPPEGWKMVNPFGPPYAQFINAGWTDATLKQNGYLIDV